MSGDVQPRKRKDKKRKRDDRKSEAEIVFSRKQSLQEDEEPREQHQGVHDTNMGSDDVHLHVQSDDHGTGGHWCAKVFFFSLLAILLGLIGLIILENRGISDLDTPLSQSRFSNYFEGWVDESRPSHDEHDVVTASIEEHEHDDEPFEEEEDHSAAEDDEDEHDNDDEHDDDEHDDDNNDDEEDDEENNTEEENDDGGSVKAKVKDEDDEEDEDDDDDAGDDSKENDKQTAEEDDDDDEDNDNDDDDDDDRLKKRSLADDDDDDDNDDDNNKSDENDTNDDDDDEDNNDNDNDDDQDEDDNIKKHHKKDTDNDNDDDSAENETKNAKNDDDDDDDNDDDDDDDDKNDDNDPFDEEDDEDDAFDSVESIVDNDAEELLLLQEKARLQAEQNKAKTRPAEEVPYASPQIKPKVGGGPQSYVEDEFLAAELRQANEEMMRDNLEPALKLYDAISHKYPDYPQAFYGKAKALDKLSELHQSNQILGDSIEAYKRYLAFGEDLNDDEFKEAAERCIDRMRFKGIHMQAIAIHQMLVKRFTEEPYYRNQMAVTYLQVNRLADAKLVLHETLLRWRNNGFALVHYGFVLKSLDKNLELGARYLREGIESGADGTQEGKFFFHLGDCLQRLGRSEEARQVYRKGVEKKLFLSEYQRSLYNCGNLKAQPFWNKAETTYEKFFNALEINWEKIRDEGLGALNQQGYFIDESENLRDVGDWKEFELFARGYKNNKNCIRAPLTCGIIEMFPAARYCKRGQIKFSVLHPSTHVWPHCGPTNCRLRAHLGLQVPAGTKIRVCEEERTWEEGEFLIFDDSFEHEVWNNGTSVRLVLIVDVWHPDLTEEQRKNLDPI